MSAGVDVPNVNVEVDQDGDAWCVRLRGRLYRVFGEVEKDTAFFVEAPASAGPAVSSATSELNALLAERPRPLREALMLLEKHLRNTGAAVAAQDVAADSEEEDSGSSWVADDVGLLAAPVIQEAKILPAVGSEEEFEAAMDRLVHTFSKAAESFGCPLESLDAASLVLSSCRWDDAHALEQLKVDPVALAQQACIAPSMLGMQRGGSSGSRSRPSRCGVCFEDFATATIGTGLSAGCDHLFCRGCWCQHLMVVARGGPGGGGRGHLDACCPYPGCKLRVGLDVYKALDLDELAQGYQKALVRSFMEDNGAVVECPGCGLRLLLGPARPDAGPCRHCGRHFCSLCLAEAHLPITCAERRTWLRLMEDSKRGLLERWAQRARSLITMDDTLVARRCPNPDCGVMSQKVEGCLFLQCPRCRELWCWQCGEWGGGPSARPRPHHVFLCTKLPTDVTWLDGHINLQEDAKVEFFRALWDGRSKDLEQSSEKEDLPQDLRAAVKEAKEVLQFAAAWRFFETDDSKRRLFEFAENDLVRFLTELERPKKLSASQRAQQIQRDRDIAAALKTQAQALRSYRRAGNT